MIKNGKPFCDECGKKVKALSERAALDDITPHGWTNWKTAGKILCETCEEKILKDANFPPCDECETHPCERGRDCWAEGRYPIHRIPYETYTAAQA